MQFAHPRYSSIVTGIAIALGAYLAALAVNAVAAAAIAPGPVVQDAIHVPQAAVRPRAFAVDAERLAKLFDVPLPKPASITHPPRGAGEWGEPVRSSLHGTLIATAIADPRRYSLCQIANPDLNETQVYAIGDEYQGARIYEIEKDRVLLDHGGVNEFLDGSGPETSAPAPSSRRQPEGVRQLSEHVYVLERGALNDALTNLPDLATQARIVLSFRNGAPDGFKIFSIVPRSFYAKIGIQDGDVIRRINGYEMSSPDRALEIYQKLRDASRIEVEIDRHGQILRNTYSID